MWAQYRIVWASCRVGHPTADRPISTAVHSIAQVIDCVAVLHPSAGPRLQRSPISAPFLLDGSWETEETERRKATKDRTKERHRRKHADGKTPNERRRKREGYSLEVPPPAVKVKPKPFRHPSKSFLDVFLSFSPFFPEALPAPCPPLSTCPLPFSRDGWDILCRQAALQSADKYRIEPEPEILPFAHSPPLPLSPRADRYGCVAPPSHQAGCVVVPSALTRTPTSNHPSARSFPLLETRGKPRIREELEESGGPRRWREEWNSKEGCRCTTKSMARGESLKGRE